MLDFQIFLSNISDTGVILPVLFVMSAVLYFLNKKKYIYEILFSSSIATAITFLLKYIFNIPRPINMLIQETSPRFPSGHATMAGVVSTLIFYFSYKYIKNKYLRVIAMVLAILWLPLISYSRIYLHAHYFIDVVVGGSIGIASTIFVLYFFKHIRYYK